MHFPQPNDTDETLKQYYQILRCRQTQIIGIIKETTEMVDSLDFDSEQPNFDKNSERRINLAFSMINALANILDEQVKALDIWERILAAGERTPEAPALHYYQAPREHEISFN
jgi:hypothetical protein